MQTEVFKFKVVKFKTHQEASRYAQKQLLETINK